MSLCINPRCQQPTHPDNGSNLICASCGTDLLLNGRYRVMRLISTESGFGYVYEAYDRNIPKILKVLKENYNHNHKVVELFRREAQVLSQMHHAGVPKIETDGYFLHWPKNSNEPIHCLVMEKIDGLSLKQWMIQQGNHPISEKQAILWLTQLTDVLHLVHQQNYFHRDIKPENVMLRSSGQLVLVDFGAAREMTHTYVAHLNDSDITAVSSAGYTPPEQEQGQAVPQSDFYAMGRTIIYLLTAKLPSDITIYNSRTNTFQWRHQATHISSALADLIDALIAPAANQRPQTTGAILERLAQIKASQASTLPASPRPKPGAQTSWPETTLDPHDLVTTADPPRSFLPPWIDQRPWLLVGLTGLAFALPLGLYTINRIQGFPWPSIIGPARVQRVTVTSQAKLSGHKGDIFAMVLLRNGETLVTTGADQTIRFWDLATRQASRPPITQANVVHALALTADQEVLISAGDDRSIYFWATEDSRLIKQIDNAHPVPIRALTVSHNGKMLASADSDGNINLWELTDSEGNINPQHLASLLPRHRLKADGTVNDIRFSRDNGYLISGGKSLQVWNMETLGQPITLEGHEPLTFVNRLEISSDNKILISASSDKTIRLWNLEDQTPRAILHTHQSYVNDLRIDGPQLWSSDENKTILVWDLNQDTQLQAMTGFDTDIWRFTVQPNDTIITIGGKEHTIGLWHTN